VRVALDTNVLGYAEGAGEAARCEAPRELIGALPEGAAIVPARALGELFDVLTRKLRRSRERARTAVLEWADSVEVVDFSWPAVQSALDLCTDHELQVWDALILQVAAEHQCRILLSEDLQPGFTWRGVTVVDLFAEPRDGLLERALQTR
jgi:predicted nucleic acid-binding protein